MNLLDVNKLSYTLSFHLDNPLDETNCFSISYYPASRFGYVSFCQLCLLAGTFHGYVLMNSTKVSNELSSFKIIPGPLYIPYCLASFTKNQSSYQAGELITFDVLLKDAYNNTVSKANGRVDEFSFTYQFVETETNISVTPKNLSRISRRGLGHETINFTFTFPGNYSLHVGGAQPETNLFWRASDGRLVSKIMDSQQAQVKDAPFGFEITTGDPYISNYDVIWRGNINSFSPSGEAILEITARDVFNNTIDETSLSQDPFVNLQISTTPRNGLGPTPIIFSVNKTEQLVMFNVSTVAGDYSLYVGDGNYDAADSPLSYKILNGPLSIANSPGIWRNESNIFKAGTEAFLLVLLQDAYNNTIDDFVNFSLSFSIANDSNSLIVATTKVDKEVFEFVKDSPGPVAVTTSFDKENVYERIRFNLTSAGRYILEVKYNDTSIMGSPFSFTVAPGPLSAISSMGGPWLDDKNNFRVGQIGVLVVHLEDIYGNKISASDGVPKNMNGTVNCNNGQFAASVKLSLAPLDNSSSAKAVFSVDFSGECLLSITNSTANIIGSPFNFTSYSGNISIPFCFGSWINGSNTFTAGKQVYLEVTFRDRRRNLVQPIYPYTQFSLILKLSNGSTYSSNISFLPGRDPSHGIVTFNITLAGEFSLYVGDGRFQIQNSPFLFEVLQGPVSGNNSEGVWPSGANRFEAGDTVILTLRLFDAYGNRVSSLMSSSFLFFYTTWYNGTLLDANHEYDGIINSDTLKFTSTLTGNFHMHVSDFGQNEIQGSPFEFSVMAGDAEIFKVHWIDGVSTFKAGSIGILEILLTDQYNNSIKNSDDGDLNSVIDTFVKPSPERPGVADLRVFSDKERGQVNVSFLAISAGTYYLHVLKNNKSIQGSPFSFEVVSGTISTRNCRGYWLNERNTFVAGDLTSLLVEFSDAFNNNVTLESEPLLLFQRSEAASNKTAYKLKRIELKPGYEIVTFYVTMSGNASLHVTDEDNVAIFGSPFAFKVNPGPFTLLNTTAEWQYGVNTFQVYSVAELFIYPHDKYLNPLSLQEANFQALVYQEGSIEPLPSPDLSIAPHPTISWIQVLSFTAGTVGKFKLYVRHASNGNIARSPYSFEVFEGSNDVNASVVSGSGLNQAVAGELTSFSVEIHTADGKPGVPYPGSVSVLFKKEGSEFPASFKVLVASTYFPFQENLEVFAVSKNVNIVAENSNGSFKVQYSLTPGNYEVYVLWTNIILNDGKPFSLAVLPGTVDVSKCQCYKSKYDTGSRVKAWNYINVILKDSSDYEVYGKADLLSLSVSSNAGTFRIKDTVDNGDGTYVAAYMPMAVGLYKINVTYDGLAIPSCSMTAYAHTERYYPWAKSDNVRVIQDAVATIDVLYNDTNGSGSLLLYNITEEPVHGTCVIYYEQIVYVPVLGSVGSDTFMYAVQDENSNFGFGMVIIEIHAELPKIISFSETLEALEDEPITFDGPANYNGENYLFISVIDGYEISVNKSIQLTIQPVNDPPYVLAPYKMVLGSDGHVWHGFFENNTQFANEDGSEFIRVGDPDEFDLRGRI
ncbi:hypothetical protein GOP47_0014810 [Adiantum capillus-veneris]|uniref:GEX2 N-terminal Ig-like domain-containing protein n=1 Tax=Adiantum capillus-veneris TaxID=13818 RepID=A0A9D4UN27_ADICA|nr:hypothetical protein GOP47_0014810 [Adiantum capillus-veneris]